MFKDVHVNNSMCIPKTATMVSPAPDQVLIFFAGIPWTDAWFRFYNDAPTFLRLSLLRK
jgi:hypothetical protein